MALESVELQKIRDRVLQYFERSQNLNGNDPKAKTSKFWRDIFDSRNNFPSFGEHLTFRRNSFTLGIGQGLGDEASEELAFNANLSLVEKTIGLSSVSLTDETIFGSPYMYKIQGCYRSSVFLLNLPTSQGCLKFSKSLASKGKALRVLEIGAGFGMASYQIQKNLSPETTYVICDLPENLLLSSCYLALALKKPIQLIEGKIDQLDSGTCYFTLPAFLGEVTEKFDIVVNSFSLQEMDKDTVESYIEYIQKHLSEEGIFYSVNSHNKAGILRAEQYNFQNFEIRSLLPFRSSPSGLFNTIPYEVVLSPAKATTPAYEVSALNALCEMMQLGLDENLREYCKKFVEGGLSRQEVSWLKSVAEFFYSAPDKKMELLETMLKSYGQNINVAWIACTYLFASGEFKYAKKILSNHGAEFRGFAKAWSIVLNHLIGSDDVRLNQTQMLEGFGELAPNLKEEIQVLAQSGGLFSRVQTHFLRVHLLPERRSKLGAIRNRIHAYAARS